MSSDDGEIQSRTQKEKQSSCKDIVDEYLTCIRSWSQTPTASFMHLCLYVSRFLLTGNPREMRLTIFHRCKNALECLGLTSRPSVPR